MLIVEDPNLHAALFRLVEDDIQIPPPRFATKSFMRARLHAKRLHVCLIDGADQTAINLFVLASYP